MRRTRLVFFESFRSIFFQVNFREIPSHVLQKVCMYFTYKTRSVYLDVGSVGSQCILWHALLILGISSCNFRYVFKYLSEYFPEFEFPIPPEIALDLLMAANFLFPET